MRLCVSRCLLGECCRYDGRHRLTPEVAALARYVERGGGEVVDVCPECEGGLPTPRPAVEILRGRVKTKGGTDVTEYFVRGAERSLFRLRAAGGAPLAVLCSKSPSCGVRYVYDGTHTGTLTQADGIFCRRLREEGVCVASEMSVRAARPSVEHPVALVLGTGLGHLAGLVKPVRRIAYRDMEGFPASARPLAGHRFEATIGTIASVPVIVYPGRIHLYQGYDALQVTSLVRHAHKLGSRTIIFACATGAVPGAATPGLGVISDHINFTGHNPLVGWGHTGELSRVDTGLFDMVDVYSPYLKGIAKGVAADEGITLGEGVLAGVLGPSFETQAEVAMFKTLGVSYVGMSCVLEAIMAHALGMQVLGLTLAANYAGSADVTHQTVLGTARAHADEFERLVCKILTSLAADEE